MHKYNKEYAKKNREKILKIKSKYNNKVELRDKFKNYKLKHRFGITINVYNKMKIDQNGLCKICNKKETAKHRIGNKVRIKDLAVDHCHKTGKVRGLLCSICNRALGYAKEDVKILSKMIEYLLENK